MTSTGLVNTSSAQRVAANAQASVDKTARSITEQVDKASGNLVKTSSSLRSIETFLEMRLKNPPSGGIDAKKAKVLLDEAFYPAAKEYLATVSRYNDTVVAIEGKLRKKVFPN